MTRNWLDLEGSVVRYELRPGTGPTVVMLHEMGGTLESWDEVVALLPPDWQLLRYDLRGHGLSEKLARGCSVDDHVGDLRALLSALHIEGTLSLIGVAVGAAVAIRFTAQSPEPVARLLALAPACGCAPEAREGLLARAGLIADEGMRGAASALFDLAFPVDLRTDPAGYLAYRARWLSSDSRGLAATLRMLAEMDLTADLAAAQTRMTLVGGQFDLLRPRAEIERLSRLAPAAEVVHVPSGHFMSIHSPRLVAALLAACVGQGVAAERAVATFLDDPAHRVGAAGHAA